ncbi:MAG: hypothetical protein WBG18_26905 [Xanthobacteraceae bacterium]|jgi:hypothetical protein
MPQRRFPPWSVEDIGGSFVVKTSNDRPLVFIYYWNGIGRRSFARLLTRNTDRGEYRQAAGASAEGLICTAICPNRLIRMPEIGTLIGSGSLGVIMRVIAIHLILVGLLVVLAQPAQLAPTQAAATQTVPWHPCARITAACTRAGDEQHIYFELIQVSNPGNRAPFWVFQGRDVEDRITKWEAEG